MKSIKMKKERVKDRRIVIYEPLLFGSIAIGAGIIYLIIKAVS